MSDAEATPDLVQLVDMRDVCTSEPDEAVRWQEGLIKELTGGEPLEVRTLRAGFLEEAPEFRLKISGPHTSDSPDREQ